MLNKILNEKKLDLILEIISVLTVIFFGFIMFANNTLDFGFYHNGDVHRGFHRGLDIWAGVNSYESFNTENMLTQEKVPGFFPLYFYVMSLFVWISDFSFMQFLDNLRIFTFIFYSIIGLLIYLNLRRFGYFIAIFGMIFFMFNRWTVFNVISLKQESYTLLLLLISTLILEKNKYLAFLLFGIATGIKHLTILIFPLFIFVLYQDYLKNKATLELKKILLKYFICFILFVSPILIPSISYLQTTPDKFLNAILFNITREPESEAVSNFVVGLDKTLTLYNQDNLSNFLLILPRLPLLFVLILVNILLFRGYIDKWVYASLSYFTFICFNPVLFSQYMVWFFVFFPFTFNLIINKFRNK
jgi:hypothetical protein